jgi:hypothetical protein
LSIGNRATVPGTADSLQPEAALREARVTSTNATPLPRGTVRVHRARRTVKGTKARGTLPLSMQESQSARKLAGY